MGEGEQCSASTGCIRDRQYRDDQRWIGTHRTHATASGPGQFNPCLRQPFSRQSESPDRSGTLLSIGRRDACDSGASRLALADNVGNRHLLGNELEFEKGVGDVLLLRDNGVIQVLDPV